MVMARDVTVGQLDALSIALYVRDIFGLPVTDHHIPRVDPLPQELVVSLESSQAKQAAGDWSTWWSQLVLQLRDRRGMGQFAALTNDVTPCLEKLADLDALASPVLLDAHRWAATRRSEFASRRRVQAGRDADSVEMTALRGKHHIGFRQRPFEMLRIVALPVHGVWSSVADTAAGTATLLVSTALILDSDAYVAWLRQVRI